MTVPHDTSRLVWQRSAYTPNEICLVLIEDTIDFDGHPTQETEVFMFLEPSDFPWMITQLRTLLTELEAK